MAEEKKEVSEEQKQEAPKEVAKPKKTNLIYAALLLNSAGKEINEESVKKIVSALDETVDDAQIKALVAALDGVNIDDVVSKAAMPVAVAAPAQESASKEEKAEPSEEQKEKKAEEAAEGLGALFG